MHFRLGQAARHDAQDQASWHPRRQRRLLAQSDRLQSDPHSQIGCGVSGLCVHTTPKYFVRAKKPLPSPQPRTPQNASKTPTSEFFSELLEDHARPIPGSWKTLCSASIDAELLLRTLIARLRGEPR